MKNPWSNRWDFVKHHIPDNVSVVDFGCGNREVLDYISPSNYVGVDQCESADIVADLNQPLLIDKKFDIALLLGVLEYMQNPEFTLGNIAGSADCFVVLTLPVKKKSEWACAFTEHTIDQLLNKFFGNVQHHRHGRYILSVCRK
jgi:hypothetical protein